MPDDKELKGGRYVLLRGLGEGSQAETWEALDRGSHYKPTAANPKKPRDLAAEWKRYLRQSKDEIEVPATEGGLCAIKCFRVGKAKSWKDVELAEREALTLAELSHPHLPRYIEHFEENGALYLVMEKIEGESLAEIRKKRPLGAPEVTRMLRDCGDALRYLRDRSAPIVHRDIKPGNVIRRPDGSFAIVDFGSVANRLRPAGGSTVVGTFGYMAPEQFQGRASSKSDVFGVGATALAMLTGCEPEDLPHVGLGIDVPKAVPAGTPAGLVRALAAMLEPDPDRRVATVDEALVLLEPARPARPARSEPPPRASARPTRPLTRKEERAEKHARRRAEREARRARRKLARGRRVPFLPLLVGHVGLLVAAVVVSIAVGVVVPFVLTLLSLLFGPALRRAAGACVRAAKRAQSSILGASGWLRGHRSVNPHVRVGAVEDPARVRVGAADPDAAEAEQLDEPPEKEPRRARRGA